MILSLFGPHPYMSFHSCAPCRPITAIQMISLRSKLAGTALDFVCTLATSLGRRFSPLVHLFFPTLLHVCQKAKKVNLSRASQTIHTITDECASSQMLTHLKPAIADSHVSVRIVAAEALRILVQKLGAELRPKIDLLENAIRIAATDANPEVRKTTQKTFDIYKYVFADRLSESVDI